MDMALLAVSYYGSLACWRLRRDYQHGGHELTSNPLSDTTRRDMDMDMEGWGDQLEIDETLGAHHEYATRLQDRPPARRKTNILLSLYQTSSEDMRIRCRTCHPRTCILWNGHPVLHELPMPPWP